LHQSHYRLGIVLGQQVHAVGNLWGIPGIGHDYAIHGHLHSFFFLAMVYSLRPTSGNAGQAFGTDGAGEAPPGFGYGLLLRQTQGYLGEGSTLRQRQGGHNGPGLRSRMGRHIVGYVPKVRLFGGPGQGQVLALQIAPYGFGGTTTSSDGLYHGGRPIDGIATGKYPGQVGLQRDRINKQRPRRRKGQAREGAGKALAHRHYDRIAGEQELGARDRNGTWPSTLIGCAGRHTYALQGNQAAILPQGPDRRYPKLKVHAFFLCLGYLPGIGGHIGTGATG